MPGPEPGGPTPGSQTNTTRAGPKAALGGGGGGGGGGPVGGAIKSAEGLARARRLAAREEEAATTAAAKAEHAPGGAQGGAQGGGTAGATVSWLDLAGALEEDLRRLSKLQHAHVFPNQAAARQQAHAQGGEANRGEAQGSEASRAASSRLSPCASGVSEELLELVLVEFRSAVRGEPSRCFDRLVNQLRGSGSTMWVHRVWTHPTHRI